MTYNVNCTIQKTIWERQKAGRYDSTKAICSICKKSTTSYGSGDNSVKRSLVLLKESCPMKGHFYVADVTLESRKYKGAKSTTAHKDGNVFSELDKNKPKVTSSTIKKSQKSSKGNPPEFETIYVRAINLNNDYSRPIIVHRPLNQPKLPKQFVLVVHEVEKGGDWVHNPELKLHAEYKTDCLNNILRGFRRKLDYGYCIVVEETKETQDLFQQGGGDASAIESINCDGAIKTRANDAHQYATKKLEIAVGIVDSHHRSGKGFSIYLDLDKKLSARKRVFFGKGLPEVGTWLELKLANDGQQLEVLEAHRVEPQDSERVELIKGTLKLNPNGFGFVDDTFIAPYLLNGFNDQEHVEATKIWDKDPKKGTPSWRVIKIAKSQSIMQEEALLDSDVEYQRLKSIFNKLSFEDFEGFILWFFPCNDRIFNCLFSYWDSTLNNDYGTYDIELFTKFDSRNEKYLSSSGGTFGYGDDLYLNWALSQNTNIPWSLELIDKYRDKWLWHDLSENHSLPWSVELIDKYQDRWDWSVFSRNSPLPWTVELIEKYQDRWNWGSLSAQDSIPWSVELIEKYKDSWSWLNLSNNRYLPWSVDFIDEYQEQWVWSNLSANDSLPWSVKLIEKYRDRWDWEKLSAQDSLPWSTELIDKYQERWDWTKLSAQDSLPWSVELINKYKDHWDWKKLSAQDSLPWSTELIDKYQERWDWAKLSAQDSLLWSVELIDEYKDHWDWLKLSFNFSLPWSEELIEKYHEKWCWRNLFLCQKKLTLSFFDKYSSTLNSIDWAWISSHGSIDLSSTQVASKLLDSYEDKWAWEEFDISDWPLELIVKYSDRLDLWSLCSDGEWTSKLIEKLKDNIDWTFLGTNKNVPWSLDLIDKHLDKITWIKYFHKNDACPYGGHIGNLSMFGCRVDLKDRVLDSIRYQCSTPSSYLSVWCKDNFKRIENDLQSLIIGRFKHEQKKSEQ